MKTAGRGDTESGRLARPLLLVILLLAMATACHRDVEQLLTRAVEAWDSGDYKTAADEYERYLYQRPTGEQSAEARFQLANIYYFKLKRYDQARSNYSAFIEQNPSNPNAPVARERLAEVLGEMGRSYEAIAEYENLNPQDTNGRRRVRLRIADLYFAQRNYSQALTEYEKVVEAVPYDALSEQAYLREASVYHIERGQYQLALPVYEKLVSMTGDPKVRVRAAYGTAECYAGMYRFDDAIKALRSIRDDSEQADVTRRIAEMEAQKREAAQARSGLPATAKQSRAPETAEAVKPETKNEVAAPASSNASNARKQSSSNRPPTDNSNSVRNARPQRSASSQANSNQARNGISKRASNQQTANANQPRSKPKKAINANR